MPKISDDGKDTKSLPAIGRIKSGFNDGSHAGLGPIAGGLFILAAFFVMLCPLLFGSCSKEEKSEPAPPPAAQTSRKAVPPAAQAAKEAVPPAVQPPVAEPPKTDSPPPKPPVRETLADRYLKSVAIANIGIVGFSDALDITGDVTNHGNLIVDEVEISIKYRNGAGETVFTDQHKLIGELPSPLPLWPGRTLPFIYEIDSEYYTKAPELDVEITDLHILLPRASYKK